MNQKNLWIAVLSGAVVTTLVSNLPWVGLVNCLAFAGFWGSALLTVWLYRRLNGSVTFGQAVKIGALTGLCAGALGFGLSFFSLAGYQGLTHSISASLPAGSIEQVRTAISADILAFNLVGVTFNIVFGTIGGLLGGPFFRSDRQVKNVEVQA